MFGYTSTQIVIGIILASLPLTPIHGGVALELYLLRHVPFIFFLCSNGALRLLLFGATHCVYRHIDRCLTTLHFMMMPIIYAGLYFLDEQNITYF